MTDAQPSGGEAVRSNESAPTLTPPAAAEHPPGEGVITDDAVLMARLLWPEPVVLTLSRTPTSHPGRRLAEFVPLRLGDRTPILLPVTRRAAARAVRRHSQGLRVRQRWTRSLLSVGLATGLAQRVVRERLTVTAAPADVSGPTFEGFLAEFFGRPVLTAISLGPLRANRKPVVQVITPDGQTLAFVKVGWNTLTRSLARREAQTLRQLEQAHVSTTVPPRLLYAGAWGSLEVLVVSALHQRATVPRRRSSLPLAAMREISSVAPWRQARLDETPFWCRLDAFRSVVDGPERKIYDQALDAVARVSGHVRLSFGTWHGDWTPWNMAWQRNGTVQVWDWERFEAGVPVGFDALHYTVETYSRRGGSLRSGVNHTSDNLRGLLKAFDVAPEHDVLVLTLYLLELFRRWYTDSSEELGGLLKAKTEALLKIISSLLPVSAGAEFG